jgi:glutamine synthetase
MGEASEADGEVLPLSWAMAEQCFGESAFVTEWLGPEFQQAFCAMKRQERATLLARVPDVEYDAYLRRV